MVTNCSGSTTLVWPTVDSSISGWEKVSVSWCRSSTAPLWLMRLTVKGWPELGMDAAVGFSWVANGGNASIWVWVDDGFVMESVGKISLGTLLSIAGSRLSLSNSAATCLGVSFCSCCEAGNSCFVAVFWLLGELVTGSIEKLILLSSLSSVAPAWADWQRLTGELSASRKIASAMARYPVCCFSAPHDQFLVAIVSRLIEALILRLFGSGIYFFCLRLLQALLPASAYLYFIR